MLFELDNLSEGERVHNKPNIAKGKERTNETLEANRKHIKNPSDKDLTKDQISFVSKGLKFSPTSITNDNLIRRQLLRDFHRFARRMRGKDNEDNGPHPFYVKSNWEPPVQPSVPLQSHLERVKFELAEVHITKPKIYLPAERKAVGDLKTNTEITSGKLKKGTTSVFISLADKKAKGTFNQTTWKTQASCRTHGWRDIPQNTTIDYRTLQ